jgi:phosphatidate phosphatase APP1
VAAFYRALFQGAHEEIQNPLFYVSSSPWNIYDLLSEFFNLQNIPIGPIMFLRDWGISKDGLLPTTHSVHKLRAIRKIMDLYQDLPFILIGDSGQEDPEIYAEAVDLYPKRILAIYIRNVSRDLKRPEAIRELAKKVAEAGSTLILADDTLPLAQHALEQGWISPEAIPEIAAEKAADEAPPSPLETLLGKEEEAEAPTVVVEAGSTEATKEAVDAGAIEEALKTETEETKKPPAVKLEGETEEDGG